MRKENIVSRAAAAATALVLLGGVVFTSCQQPTTTEPETAKRTVTFKADNGTEATSVTVEDGKTVAKPETDPTKNGYDFGGWQNGEAAYDFAAAVTSNLTLTAKWTAKTYTITYELNGGTNSADNPATYTIETEDITLKDPTGPAAAPVFQGWYSDKEFQNRVNPAVIAKGSTGDRTFYARFGAEALKEFTVTFNVVAEAGGAVLGSDSIKVNDGDKISDAQLEAAKAKIASLGEYEYDGLYTDAALAAAFDTSTKITADTALYVKVKAVQKFTVTFDSDGGSAVAAVTVKGGEKAAKPADPAKDGYTFKGWLLGDAEYNFETLVTGDITLKAKWEAKAVEPAESGVIWTGSVDTGTAWDSAASLGIDADKFASCEAGGTFTLYVTLGTALYHQVKLCSNGEGWSVLDGIASDLNANTYNCVTVSASTLSFKMNEADLEIVKANGFRIQGYDVTLTKLTYKAPPAPGTIVSAVPEGATALLDFGSMTELPGSLTAPGFGYEATLVSDDTYGKVLDLSLKEGSENGSYATMKITFDAPLDLTGKSVCLMMKGKSGLEGKDDLKLVYVQDDTHKNETNNIYPSDDTKFSELVPGAGWVCWTEDKSISEVNNWTSITALEIQFQKADYNFQIAAIYYK